MPYVPYAVKKYVANALDRAIEDKVAFISIPSTVFASVNTTWKEMDCSSIAEGLTGASRIGKKIRIKSVEIRGVFTGGQVGAAADDYYNTIRCVVALWDGAATAPLATPVFNMNYPLTSVSQQQLIKKYYDQYICSRCNGGDADGTGLIPLPQQFKFYKRWKNGLLIEFGDDTASYPDKRVVWSMVSDSTALPHPGFVNGYMKITYEDA